MGRPNFFNITDIFIWSYTAMTRFVIDLEKCQKYTFQGVIHHIITIRILIRAPKMGHFGYFRGTKNGTSGARIKILRPLFNTNTPPKPPI